MIGSVTSEDHWVRLPLNEIAQLAAVQLLQWPLMERYGVSVALKREDLLHPQLGGNKFYKLYGHLQRHQQNPSQSVLSFGGAYSNHLYALAAAGRIYGFPTIGVIRGEAAPDLSPTLSDAQQWGMRLHFVSREAYRQKHTDAFKLLLQERYGPYYAVPEGAGDQAGAEGCVTWAQESLALAPWSPTAVCLAVGTGATLAGVLAGSRVDSVHGFLALKGRAEEIQVLRNKVLCQAQRLTAQSVRQLPALHIESDYHCGGYARFPSYLRAFTADLEQELAIPLDPVYTAKMLWGVAQKVVRGEFAPGSRLLLLHTGGLQGRRGYPELGANNSCVHGVP